MITLTNITTEFYTGAVALTWQPGSYVFPYRSPALVEITKNGETIIKFFPQPITQPMHHLNSIALIELSILAFGIGIIFCAALCKSFGLFRTRKEMQDAEREPLNDVHGNDEHGNDDIYKL